MRIVAGTFRSRDEAQRALDSLQRLGIGSSEVYIIDGSDRAGYDREHRSTSNAVIQGALLGAVIGIAAGGALMLLARVHLFVAGGPLAGYIGLILAAALGAGVVSGLWNIGVSHDEAQLFEEARKNGSVIAAVQVANPIDDRVAETLADHGASNVRRGNWQPRGWKHAYPSNTAPRHHFEG
jgi:hypothetical protein